MRERSLVECERTIAFGVWKNDRLWNVRERSLVECGENDRLWNVRERSLVGSVGRTIACGECGENDRFFGVWKNDRF